MTSPLPLALTGITSGVGLRLAEVALARGRAVTGLVRDLDRADARSLAKLGARLVKGDLDAKASLAELCAGAGAVVHMAAQVGDQGTPADFERVNVGGTRSVVEAAATAGVKRFVQLSSTAVYGRPAEGRVTEDWPRRTIGTPYEDTKTEAERIAFELGKERGLLVSAIRPPIIYGPHDRNFMPRLLDALAGRRFLLIDGGRAPLNVVWVDHVVDALLLAAEKEGAVGEAFNVMDEVDRAPPTVREVAEIVARAAGLPLPWLHVPQRVAMPLARLVEAGWRLAGREGPAPLTPFTVTILTRHVVYDASRAARVLGWTPKVSARDGLAEAARHARTKRRGLGAHDRPKASGG